MVLDDRVVKMAIAIYGERDALPKALLTEVTEVTERPKVFQPLRFRDGEETEYP